jgi:hypothetical protein
MTEVTYLGPKPVPEPGEPLQRVEPDYKPTVCLKQGCIGAPVCRNCLRCRRLHCACQSEE